MEKDSAGNYRPVDSNSSNNEDEKLNLDKFKTEVDRHMENWLASRAGSRTGSNLPPITVVDDGTDPKTLTLVDDPVWRKRVDAKEMPMAYWEAFVKGRKAWAKKYEACIPHGSHFRVYLHTPEGPLQRVPAWATYVLPGDSSAQFVEKQNRTGFSPLPFCSLEQNCFESLSVVVQSQQLAISRNIL
jgi:hypothetical protein